VRRSLAPLALSAAFAVACGSSSAPPSSRPASTPPSPSAINALADLPQDLALAPGTRNSWDLDADFALGDGGDDQFDRAMQLLVGVPATPPTADSLPIDFPNLLPFPSDQALGELAWTTPLVARGEAQLASLVASANVLLGKEVVLAGSWAAPAAGGAVVGTRLSLAVDLTGAATPLRLGWTHHGLLLDGTISGAATAWRVVVRDTASGNELEVWTGNVVADGPVAPVDVSAMAGKQVSVVFELRGSPRSFMAVDQVSLTAAGNELLANGGFDGATLAPWTVTGPDQPCQVVSGKRPVGGLVLERRVFARPERRWARFVDRFTNLGTSTVTTEASYLHELGALSDAVVQSSGGGKAFSSWDASGVSPARRDLAVVYGTSRLPAAWRGATGLAAGDGSPLAWTRFPLSVPPGQTRVIVQFVVLTEFRTGDTAASAATRSALADQEAAAIVGGFWSDPAYREAMSPEDQGVLVNF
jgi:hypothetical protein